MPAQKRAHQKVHRTRPGASAKSPELVSGTGQGSPEVAQAIASEAKPGAGVCEPLITFSIDSSECMGCMLCARNCPRKGITGEKGGQRFRALARGERKKAPTIEQAACIKCGTCFETCPFGAVRKA